MNQLAQARGCGCNHSHMAARFRLGAGCSGELDVQELQQQTLHGRGQFVNIVEHYRAGAPIEGGDEVHLNGAFGLRTPYQNDG